MIHPEPMTDATRPKSKPEFCLAVSNSVNWALIPLGLKVIVSEQDGSTTDNGHWFLSVRIKELPEAVIHVRPVHNGADRADALTHGLLVLKEVLAAYVGRRYHNYQKVKDTVGSALRALHRTVEKAQEIVEDHDQEPIPSVMEALRPFAGLIRSSDPIITEGVITSVISRRDIVRAQYALAQAQQSILAAKAIESAQKIIAADARDEPPGPSLVDALRPFASMQLATIPDSTPSDVVSITVKRADIIRAQAAINAKNKRI